MTDDDRYVLIQQGVGKYKVSLAEKQEAEKEARSAGGVFKTTCKAIIATGVSIEEVKSAILQETDEGRKTISAGIEMHLRIARYRNAPLGHQFDFFGGGEDRTPSVDKARAGGYALGIQGGDRDAHKWQPGTAQYEAHYDGYKAGQAVNIAGIKQKDAEEFDAEDVQSRETMLSGLEDSDTSEPLGSPTIAETIKAADPFEGAPATEPVDLSSHRRRRSAKAQPVAHDPAPEPMQAVAEEY